MEEDEPDYKTPIGKVIKHINTLCKKPQIDEQLGEALDLFKHKLDGQEKYLVNGIFKINFSEAALFLQSSAELYGKKLDLLWDQLLEFHTRLIRYDCEHQKEKGAAIDKEVIEKLEERRNRYKRKKKFKLLLQTSSETQNVTTVLFDSEKVVKVNTQEDDESYDESAKTWRDLESRSTEMRKIPCIVYKQMLKTYMLKNYYILKCQDYDVLDLDDEEFNTKYSRIPGWHHMLHLFEYNNKGLLPDHNNIIARLRLSAYKRIRFLASRKIPLDTPFEKYKDEYIAFRNKFFEDEAKKWQNMPLDSLEDLRKQLQYLVQKEREENGETTNTGDNVKLGRYGYIKEPTSDSWCEKIDLVDNSDDDSLFELSFTCDNDFMKSDLFVRLEKLSSDLINTKLRQDSGFFEFNSDSEDDNDNSQAACESITEGVNGSGENEPAVVSGNSGEDNSERRNDTVNNEMEGVNQSGEIVPADVTANNGENNNETTNDNVNNETSSDVNVSGNNENSIVGSGGEKDINNTAVNTGENVEGNQNVTLENCLEKNTENSHENLTDANDLDETRSYISDHDYCLSIPPLLASDAKGNNSVTDHSSTNELIGSSKNNKSTKAAVKAPTTMNDPFFAVPRIPKANKVVPKKEKAKLNNKTDGDESPPKRRKLSAKQLDKLLQSKVKPVRELKFEKFFSMNYQPQLGEGEIPLVDYESGDSDIDDVDDLPPCDDVHSEHPAHDDTQSVMSDHDYCQRGAEDPHNDSGFIDASNVTSTPEHESTQSNSNETLVQRLAPPADVNDLTACIDMDEEYEKLLATLNESNKGQDQTDDSASPREPTEEELREKERKESRARVEEWRQSITPILKNLKENDFDIHEYGSRIMDNMEVNESRPFSNIVNGKSSAEVVRYFISSLQLANTSNIEICGARQGELSNDTFNLKLLTKDRYHEHLQEFLAPSEESLREKLERVRAMAAANKQSDAEEPELKKSKLTAALKEKRTRTLNSVKRTYSRKPVNNNLNSLPTLTVQLSHDNNIEYQLNKSQTSSNINEVQDENNDSLNTYQTKSLKGKSIIRRPVMIEKPSNIHSYDISMPSTSRQYPSYPTYVSINDQMPSTSSSPDSDSSNFSVHSGDGVSPNKRRRDSGEDSFREKLLTVQGMNPGVQMQSTPRGALPSKQLKASAPLQKSLLFE